MLRTTSRAQHLPDVVMTAQLDYGLGYVGTLALMFAPRLAFGLV